MTFGGGHEGARRYLSPGERINGIDGMPTASESLGRGCDCRLDLRSRLMKACESMRKIRHWFDMAGFLWIAIGSVGCAHSPAKSEPGKALSNAPSSSPSDDEK